MKTSRAPFSRMSRKEDLFQFLKKMPTTWDESKVVQCRMGEYITTARRTGDVWFVGSVNDTTPRDLDIKLDFLKPGTAYTVTLFQDANTAHGITNPEGYEIAKRTVNSGDAITAQMKVGGGHAMIIEPGVSKN